MGILDRVQEAKQATEERLSRRGGTRASFWKPKNGKNHIRIMPPWTDPLGEGKELSEELTEFKDQFWREVGQHWNVSSEQRGPVLCPKKTPGLSGACPICEFVDELKKDKTDPKGVSLAKEIRAKTTYLYNIIDDNDPVYTAEDAAEWAKSHPGDDAPFEVGQAKVQLYAAPITVHDTVLGIITDTRNDITRLEDGQSIVLTRFPNKDPKLTRYQILPSMKPSELDLGDTELPELHHVGFTMDYEELLDLLHSGAGGDFVGSLPDSTPAKTLPAATEPAEPTVSAADLEAEMRKQLQ